MDTFHLVHLYHAGIVILLLILIISIAKWERRMVWPYSNLEPTSSYEDPTGYATGQLSEAMELGFHLLGWVRDMKGDKYKINYAILVSRMRDCLVILGIGKIMEIDVKGIWIYSQTSNGDLFYSTDNQNCVEIDVSGLWKNQLVPDENFSQLLQKHREWALISSFKTAPFTQGQELIEFQRAREDHYRKLAKMGLISFTDQSEAYWRYTFVGAIRYAFLNFFVGTVRHLTFGRFPRTA